MKTYVLDAVRVEGLKKRCYPFRCRGCNRAFKIGDVIVALMRQRGNHTKHYHSACYQRTLN